MKMPKFMDTDFLSAVSTTTTTQIRRPRRQLTVVIPGPGEIRLPVAPPSPFFDGMNEEVNTEPFPAFVDICPPVKAEPLHCILHCGNRICNCMVASEIPIPPCRCGDEVMERGVPILSFTGPEISLDETILGKVRDIDLCAHPDLVIKTQHDDARRLMAQLEPVIAARALQDEAFLAIVRQYFPGRLGREERVVVAIVEYFFNLITLYLKRTMREVGGQSLTVHNLRAELSVYASTGFEEWINKYCDEWSRDMILDNMEDPRKIMQAANFGLPGTVSKLWQECLRDVVGLLIWRDAEFRRSKANQTITCFGMGCLGIYAFAAGVGCVCGYW